jgi:hypothetical protein
MQEIKYQNLKNEINLKYSNNENTEKNNIHSFLCWFFSILTWLLFLFNIFYILFLIFNNEIHFNFYSFYSILSLVISYFLYLICELSLGKTIEYLESFKDNYLINEVLENCFKEKPKINIQINCYHIEESYETITDYNGESRTIPVKVEKSSFEKIKEFEYYTSKDISGLFTIDKELKNNPNSIFLKLNIDYDIYIADTLTYNDILNEKQNEFLKYNEKDDYIKVNVKRCLEKTKKSCKLIKIKNIETNYINKKYFYLFTFLSFAQLYKRYVNNLCIEKYFVIRKVISSRNNILNDEKFINLSPKLKLDEKFVEFPENQTTYINNDFKVNEPYEEDKEKSQKFIEFLPYFNINYEYGKYYGIIEDPPKKLPLDNYIKKSKNNVENNNELDSKNNYNLIPIK